MTPGAFSAWIGRLVADPQDRRSRLEAGTRFLSVVSSSIVGVLKPAGLDNARDLVTVISNKDVSDPLWKDDADVKAYSAFIDKYMTPADLWNNAAAYGLPIGGAARRRARPMCGDDLSRENIMRQATHLKDLTLPLALARRGEDQHEPDRLSDHPAVPDAALRRRALEDVRRTSDGFRH